MVSREAYAIERLVAPPRTRAHELPTLERNPTPNP
jgi:hypothetical protein